MNLQPRVHVASIPERHPFVDALLDDELVEVVEPGSARWGGGTPLHDLIPPLDQLDVLVANFGFEGHSVAALRQLLHDAVRAQVVVVTIVHDLKNPHLRAHLQRTHRRQLSLLVDVGLVVATVSEYAREQLHHEHDVDAIVLPHPPLGPPAPGSRTAAPGTVLLHLKSLRRNVMASEAVAAVTRLAREDDLHPVVCLHEEAIVDPNLRAALRAAADVGAEVRHHDRLSHDELVDLLLDVEVLVLPYSHGTHSGLLDLALDLGTKVVAPSTGAYAEMGATTTFAPRSRDVVACMANAVREAVAAPPPPVRPSDDRRDAFAVARSQLWRRVRCEVDAVRTQVISLDDPTLVDAP